MTVVDQHVGYGFGDPGGVSPLTGTAQHPVVDRWYDSLPAVYRDADGEDTSTSAGWPLYGYLDAVASPLRGPSATADRIAAGDLTDPNTADDAWIPWLAQAVGVTGTGVAAQRAALVGLLTSPALGSREYLAAVTRTFLTGSRDVTVTPLSGWGIQIRVLAADLDLVGDLAGLTAALYATGQVPTGYQISCTADDVTWAQVDAALPTWAPGEGVTWGRIASMGLPADGFVTGGFGWAGTAVGAH